MAKFTPEPIVVRQSFSHARTVPLVVETVKQRAAPSAHANAGLLCPSCGATMKLVRRAARLTASCPDCGPHRA